jgi:hypothetical protein
MILSMAGQTDMAGLTDNPDHWNTILFHNSATSQRIADC